MNDTIDKMKSRFTSEVATHQMSVLLDDGLYRHLRFQKPGTVIYSFDLITWPGYLTITGDVGCYVFSRMPDMFIFFEASKGYINPAYWMEKLRAPDQDQVKRYDFDRYCELVREWRDDHSEALGIEGVEKIDRELLAEAELGGYRDEFMAREALEAFRHGDLRITDAWEWDLHTWDRRFLWCCEAITWGIKRYREEKEL